MPDKAPLKGIRLIKPEFSQLLTQPKLAAIMAETLI